MVRNREIVRRVTQMVIDKRLDPYMAAELLETSVRTIFNYRKRYTVYGAPGLVDRRRGNFRKMTPQTEKQIVECKLQKPHRSARWIRHWLKLDVCVETVRQVLVKHHLHGNTANGNGTNGTNLFNSSGPNATNSLNGNRTNRSNPPQLRRTA